MPTTPLTAAAEIQKSSTRTIESFIANASFAVRGSKRVDTTDATTYTYIGILVLTDTVVADVSGFDSKHEGWANADTLLASVGYYPISGTAITLTSGTILLIKA